MQSSFAQHSASNLSRHRFSSMRRWKDESGKSENGSWMEVGADEKSMKHGGGKRRTKHGMKTGRKEGT